MKKKKIFMYSTGILILIVAIYGFYEYNSFMTPPKTRLSQGEHYKEMPQDDHHIYIQLPLDYSNTSYGNFTDFYILSPDFRPGEPVIFQLYDNQQEMVGMVLNREDFAEFDERIGPNMSYVIIGNRGVSPTLFPEIFKNGTDYALALKLYGSEQQIEDIESVRKDMAKRGLLPPDGKIMLYGGSGGGVLVQQYIDRHGDHVSRALIESTGAMDIASSHNMTFARPLYETNPVAAERFFNTSRKPSLAWMLFKIGLEGNQGLQQDILADGMKGNYLYVKNWFAIPKNFLIINTIFKSPAELEVKVRMWEVTSADLVEYDPKSPKDINLMYTSLQSFLSDFIKEYNESKINVTNIEMNRSKFNGEIMIWANSGDQDFGPEIARLIADEYPHSKLIVFNESAHHVWEKNEHQLNITKSFFENGIQ